MSIMFREISKKEEIQWQKKQIRKFLIGGRVFTLSGYESEEYLQKIALYINNKVSEYNKEEALRDSRLIHRRFVRAEYCG